MANATEPSVSMRSTWPLPQDRLSWLIAGLLLVCLIIVYYKWFYPQLEQANNQAFTYTEERLTQDGVEEPVLLKVAAPNYISNLTTQTLYLSVTSVVDDGVTVKVVPSIVLECAGESPTPCVEDADYYVFLSVPDGSQPTLAEGGYLLFSDIAPGASVSQELTIEVVGLSQAASGDGEGAATNGTSGTDEADLRPTAKVFFTIIDATGEDAAVQATEADSPAEVKPITFEDATEMEIDAIRAAVQGIMSFLLLPPWANGFIPFMAIFIVYLFGLPEAMRHWYPPQRAARPTDEKRKAVRNFIGWLLLMGVVAVLVLWALTQVAVVVLADASWTTLILPGLTLAAFALLAWWIDWTVIRLPAASPPSPPPNVAANPNSGPEMLIINTAAVTIQSPDGQPLTMPVNASALSLQLNGELFQHYPCHQPPALTAAAGGVLPNEPAAPQPPAEPPVGQVAPVSESIARPIEPNASPPAEPPVEQVAPVIDQVALPPASDLPDTAPPNPEWLALTARVRQVEAQLATLLASSALPTADPSVVGAAPIGHKPTAPPPDADIPEQPTTLPAQEGGIFAPPPPGAVPPLTEADSAVDEPAAAEPPADATEPPADTREITHQDQWPRDLF